MAAPRTRAALGAFVTVLACAGCSFGPKGGSSAISLRVTANFGAQTVTTATDQHPRGGETQLQLLERHAQVETTSGKQTTVTSIAGHAASAAAGRWFLFVNGVLADKGPVASVLTPDPVQTSVRKGDHVWWDLHDASATANLPAVVGSFPEPFLHGVGGKRYPSTLECGAGVQAACTLVTRQFTNYHIPLSPQVIGTGSGPDTLSIDVATWRQLAPEVAGELIDHGPGASGVYAHFSADGRELLLENAAGTVVRRLGAGAGLIAATGDPDDIPTWLVGGTDRAGVLAAARALTASTLAGHFALAVQGSHRYPVPYTGGG